MRRNNRKRTRKSRPMTPEVSRRMELLERRIQDASEQKNFTHQNLNRTMVKALFQKLLSFTWILILLLFIGLLVLGCGFILKLILPDISESLNIPLWLCAGIVGVSIFNLSISRGLQGIQKIGLAHLNFPLYRMNNHERLSINLVGGIIPILLAIYQFLQVSPVAIATVTVSIAALSYFSVDIVPDLHIFHRKIILISLISVMLSLLIMPLSAELPYVSVAFAGSVLGFVIGADLLHLKDVNTNGSIGGAGLNDGIFICGLQSLLISIYFPKLIDYLNGFLGTDINLYIFIFPILVGCILILGNDFYKKWISKYKRLKTTKEKIKADNLHKDFDYFRHGVERFLKRDNLGAMSDLGKAIVINSHDDLAYYFRSKVSIILGDTQGAIADLGKVIELKPEDILAYSLRSKAHSFQGDMRRSRKDEEKIFEILNKYNRVSFTRCSSAGGNSKKAQALTIASDFEIQYHNGRYQVALKSINQAISIYSDEPNFYFDRGRVYLALGDYQKAFDDFDEAINRNPNDAEALYYRAAIQSLQGDLSKAIKDFRQSIVLAPNDSQAYLLYSAAQYLNGDSQRAKVNCERAFSLNPSMDPAFSFFCFVHDNPALIPMNSKNTNFYICRSLIRMLLRDKNGGTEDCTAAIAGKPDHSYAYLFRGMSLYMQKLYKNAHQDIDRAIILNPQLAEAYYIRGNIRIVLGNKLEGFEDYYNSYLFYKSQGQSRHYEHVMLGIKRLSP